MMTYCERDSETFKKVYLNVYSRVCIFVHICTCVCADVRALLEINGITLIKKWYNPVASWYTIYGITKKNKCYTI